MRFLLVDKVEEVIPGESIRGIKNVTLSEDFLADHFPDHPVFPGTLLIEALAQLGGFLAEATCNMGAAAAGGIFGTGAAEGAGATESVGEGGGEVRRAVLAQVDKAKFHRPCVPGDQIELRCRMVSRLEGAVELEGEALVKGQRVAQAMLIFRLLRVDSEKVQAHRRELYRFWTRDLDLPWPIR